MYSKITDIYLNVFDSETNEYMGHSRFKLTQSSERKLLDLLNYNIAPDTLTLLDVALSDTSKNYIPPALFKKNSRISTLYIDAVDTYSGRLVPIEIVMSYDVIARGHLSGNPYSFESVELGNIKILNIDYKSQPE